MIFLLERAGFWSALFNGDDAVGFLYGIQKPNSS
jgi:hypothetical protein